ncbi:MAG: 1-acyl-sn-glycerol-3-phosphate acyltransferase [Alphaproteobacteria bacterium]
MDKHIVDTLLEERAPKIHERPALLRWVRRILDPILKYQQARVMADDIKYKSGAQVMQYCQDKLALEIDGEGLENMPPEGSPAIIIVNHPTGIADGVALWKWIGPLRSDLMVYGNRDTHRVTKGAYDFIVPVELVEHKQTQEKMRETLYWTKKCFDAGRTLIFFPSGRMSFMNWRQLRFRERPWKSSAIKMARRYNYPVIPITIRSYNSLLFYFFSILSEELRDICLFYELINKKGQRFKMSMGPALDLESYTNDQIDEITPQLQRFVEKGDYSKPFVPNLK